MQLTLLGSVQVHWDEGSPPRFRSQRTVALLGYLVAEQRTISRDHLAALFWPDEEPSKGKANLRRELHNLAQVLPNCWQTSRVEVEFVPDEDVTVDIYKILEFKQAEKWEEAAELIGGQFLEGVALTDNLEFEIWLSGEQERWRQLTTDVLQQAVNQFETRGDYQHALQHAQRLLQLMPWREETHQQVIQLLAIIGRRSEALKQYEMCQQVLQRELGVDVSVETETLYKRIKSHTNFKLHNLPATSTPFIGRKSELKQLHRWLSATDRRVITIIGVGGMGKTRLALAAAEQFLDQARMQPVAPFTDGVYLVDLTPLKNREQIIHHVALSLNLALQISKDASEKKQLLDYLVPKKLLLLFDNCEHLSASAEIATEILEAAPDVKILATSRERLHLRGEQLFTLDGLSYQTSAHLDLEQKIFEHEAANLFLTTARRNNPTFDLQRSAAQVDRICQLVEGMPLALELAAMWVDSMPLPAVAAEIEQSLSFLESEVPDLPPRHRSMQAVFSSSWKRLNTSEQMVLARLSVFQGGFTFDAAKSVAESTHKTLSSLVHHSFLRFDHKEQRYTMHELLRQFAAAHLQEQPEDVQETKQRHLAYFCQLAKVGEQNLRGGDQIGWTNRLLQEQNNIRMAIEWGVEHDLLTAVDLANHLYLFWFSAGLSKEGEQLYLLLLPHLSQLPDQLRAWLLTGYVAVIWLQGKFEEIEQFSLEAIPLFESLNDTTGLAISYFHLATLHSFLGDMETAIIHIDKSINYARSNAEDSWALSIALHGKTNLLLVLGEYDEVQKIAAENLQLCQQRGDFTTVTYIQLVLVDIAYRQNRFDEAKKLSLQILPTAQDLKDRRLEAYTYLSLGKIALADAHPSESIEHLNLALNFAREGNHWDILNETHVALGDAHQALQAFNAAENHYRQSADLCKKIEHSEYMAICLEKLAHLRWHQNNGELQPIEWLAAAASWREEAKIPPTPPEQVRLTQLHTEIKRLVTDKIFAEVWEKGATCSLADALATAVNRPPT